MPGVSSNIYDDKETFFRDSMHKGMDDSDKQYAVDFEAELREKGVNAAADLVSSAAADGTITQEEKTAIDDAIMSHNVPALSDNIGQDYETFMDFAYDHNGYLDAGDMIYARNFINKLNAQGFTHTATKVEEAIADKEFSNTDEGSIYRDWIMENGVYLGPSGADRMV
jgi:hypothetical protein